MLITKFLPLKINISAEANLNWDLLLFPSEGTALRWRLPSQSAPRVKVIARTPDLGYAYSNTTILEVFRGLFEYRFNYRIFDQRYYIKSYCISHVWSLPLLHYLRLYRKSDVAELQCSVSVKRKTIPAHGGLRLRSVQKHVQLHNIYQEESHVEASCFHRIL